VTTSLTTRASKRVLSTPQPVETVCGHPALVAPQERDGRLYCSKRCANIFAATSWHIDTELKVAFVKRMRTRGLSAPFLKVGLIP
jgi:hypothetical protein